MSSRFALICENGHVVSWYLVEPSNHSSPFCSECGSKTIAKCPECRIGIRGRDGKEAYFESASHFPLAHPIPAYCHNCGLPYLWTEIAIMSAIEYADELETLSDEDREQLKVTIGDLTKDSPRTQVAIVRYKKLAVKMGNNAAGAFREILIDVLSEAAKKALFT